jgi:hypothetical protein
MLELEDEFLGEEPLRPRKADRAGRTQATSLAAGISTSHASSLRSCLLET